MESAPAHLNIGLSDAIFIAITCFTTATCDTNPATGEVKVSIVNNRRERKGLRRSMLSFLMSIQLLT